MLLWPDFWSITPLPQETYSTIISKQGIPQLSEGICTYKYSWSLSCISDPLFLPPREFFPWSLEGHSNVVPFSGDWAEVCVCDSLPIARSMSEFCVSSTMASPAAETRISQHLLKQRNDSLPTAIYRHADWERTWHHSLRSRNSPLSTVIAMTPTNTQADWNAPTSRMQCEGFTARSCMLSSDQANHNILAVGDCLTWIWDSVNRYRPLVSLLVV